MNDVREGEPLPYDGFAVGVRRIKQKARLKIGVLFVGAEKRICAFSGALRSDVINVVLCRQAFEVLCFRMAKRFAPAKRLPPSNPLQ